MAALKSCHKRGNYLSPLQFLLLSDLTSRLNRHFLTMKYLDQETTFLWECTDFRLRVDCIFCLSQNSPILRSSINFHFSSHHNVRYCDKMRASVRLINSLFAFSIVKVILYCILVIRKNYLLHKWILTTTVSWTVQTLLPLITPPVRTIYQYK